MDDTEQRLKNYMQDSARRKQDRTTKSNNSRAPTDFIQQTKYSRDSVSSDHKSQNDSNYIATIS